MKTLILKKLNRAFTMIELVFVIVIVGIISVMIAPSFDGNNARQAADQIISHIRYAQHLAMMDNKFDTNDNAWFAERWKITFATDSGGSGNQVYWIMSDEDHDGLLSDADDYAKNLLDETKLLSGDTGTTGTLTPELDLTAEYGVTVSPQGSIFFDNIGRPLDGAASVYGDLLTTPYNINVTDGTQTITIRIEPETGYTHIVN